MPSAALAARCEVQLAYAIGVAEPVSVLVTTGGTGVALRDVTPEATQPIDPNQVPGRPGPEKFTAADLERAQPVQGGEVAAKAMDVLLGRNRSKPTPEEGEGEREMFDRAGETVTEEQAAAMMGVSPVQENAAAKAASLMVAAKDGGSAMPDPQPISDGSKIYSAFRRFTG